MFLMVTKLYSGLLIFCHEETAAVAGRSGSEEPDLPVLRRKQRQFGGEAHKKQSDGAVAHFCRLFFVAEELR